MGAASFRQTRSDAVTLAAGTSLSCADLLKQATRTPACPVRDEEVAGSELRPRPKLRSPCVTNTGMELGQR